MKITVGIDRSNTPESIEELYHAGAEEFFAGFVPPEWSEYYGWEISPNRRSLGGAFQYTQFEELADAAATIHDLGCPLYLTFNSHYYTKGQIPHLQKIVEACERLEPDRYIVADPAFLLLLDEWGIRRPISLSTGAACYNAESVRWFAEIADVRRIVFPRKMTFAEMRTMREELADLDLEFEAMAIGYRCFFNDEQCFSWHSGNGPMLCSEFVNGIMRTVRRLPPGWKHSLEEVLEAPNEQFHEGSALDRLVREISIPAQPIDAKRTPAEPEHGMNRHLAAVFWNHCGLCAIPKFREMGIDVIKSPTRGESWRKVYDVRTLKKVIDNPNADQAFCQSLIDSSNYCLDPKSCYYGLEE